MTSVTLYRDGEKRLTGFEVKGHTGAGEEGSDIVCAAVSAVAYTVLGSIGELCEADLSKAVIREGYMKYISKDKLTSEQYAVLSVIYKVAEVGFLQIQESYKEFIKVEYREVR